jgi:hypothetical protein
MLRRQRMTPPDQGCGSPTGPQLERRTSKWRGATTPQDVDSALLGANTGVVLDCHLKLGRALEHSFAVVYAAQSGMERTGISAWRASATTWRFSRFISIATAACWPLPDANLRCIDALDVAFTTGMVTSHVERFVPTETIGEVAGALRTIWTHKVFANLLRGRARKR